MRAIKSRMGQLRGLFGGCFGVVWGLFRGLGLAFGGGCRNDATKMHNVVGDLLNPMQRYASRSANRSQERYRSAKS